MLRLGWFSTGRGPGSRNLLKTVMDRIQDGTLDAEVSFVFCNWDNTEAPNPRRDQRQQFFEMVKGYGIPLVTESFKRYNPELRETDKTAWGEGYGRILRERIRHYDMDLGILAGYMLWMDDTTCEAYDMLNLHPALPDGPKGTWQEVIWKLIEDRAGEQGSMMHVCTSEHDRGAAITYCRFPIRGGEYDALWAGMERKLATKSLAQIKAEEGEGEPLFEKIRKDGARRELPLIVSTIGLFADGTVSMRGKRLWNEEGMLPGPYDLSAEVDASL